MKKSIAYSGFWTSFWAHSEHSSSCNCHSVKLGYFDDKADGMHIWDRLTECISEKHNDIIRDFSYLQSLLFQNICW